MLLSQHFHLGMGQTEVVQGLENTGLAIIQDKARAVDTHPLPAAPGPPPQAGRYQ